MSGRDWVQAFDEGLWLRDDEGAEDQAAFIKRALKLRKGQTVLDAPCGAGRIMLEMARAGLLVMGIDHNPHFVDRARAALEAEELPGELAVADMREIGFVECFHGAFNWGGSFGYFSEEENRRVLERLAHAVRPGGRVLVDQPNREHLLRTFRERMELRGAVVENRWNKRTETVQSAWTLRRRGSTHTYQASVRLYTRAQFDRLLKQADLAPEAHYGSAGGEDFARSSPRLIAVGRKA